MEDEHMLQEQEEDIAMDIDQGGMEQSTNHSVLPKQRCGNGVTEQEEEIIEDMLAALKRKGQEKLKRGKSSKSGSQDSGEKHNLLDEMKNATSQGTLENVNDDTPKLNASTSLWDDWGKRVESVRELIFSLDGNIVKSEFDVPKSVYSLSWEDRVQIALDVSHGVEYLHGSSPSDTP